MEAFSDGYGGWKVVDTLGKPLVELDEQLVEDLMTWRWLADIVRRQKQPKDNENGE